MKKTPDYAHLARMIHNIHIPTYTWIMHNCSDEDLEHISDALQSEFVDDEGTGTDTLYDDIVDNIIDYASSVPSDLYTAVLEPILFGEEQKNLPQGEV